MNRNNKIKEKRLCIESKFSLNIFLQEIIKYDWMHV